VLLGVGLVLVVPIDYLGPDWPATVRAQHAGDMAEMFVPEYIPFAQDGAGDFLYVDTRRANSMDASATSQLRQRTRAVPFSAP